MVIINYERVVHVSESNIRHVQSLRNAVRGGTIKPTFLTRFETCIEQSEEDTDYTL